MFRPLTRESAGYALGATVGVVVATIWPLSAVGVVVVVALIWLSTWMMQR